MNDIFLFIVAILAFISLLRNKSIAEQVKSIYNEKNGYSLECQRKYILTVRIINIVVSSLMIIVCLLAFFGVIKTRS